MHSIRTSASAPWNSRFQIGPSAFFPLVLATPAPMTFTYSFVVRSLGLARENFSGLSHRGPDLTWFCPESLFSLLIKNKQTNKQHLFCFMCLCLGMCMCVRCTWEPGEGRSFGSSETGHSDGREPLQGCWEHTWALNY